MVASPKARHMKPAPLLVALVMLSACSLTPPYARPLPPVPAEFPQGDPYPELTSRDTLALSYRALFRDQRLVALVEQALANNRDLRVAAANIEAARARARLQRTAQLPALEASLSTTLRDSNVTQDVNNTTGVAARRGQSYTASVGFTAFEIDLFGRARALSGAALQRYFQTEAAASATRITLAGDIASAWLAYAADSSLLKIAEDTAAAAGQSLALTKLRLDGGVAPATDYLQAQTVLDQARADLAAGRTARAQDQNALEFLVGARINASSLPDSIDTLADVIGDAPVGLASSILLQRPDVQQAESGLRAANFAVGVARAELFPRISLTAVGSGASGALADLFSDGSTAWSATPSLSIPLLDWGARSANVAASRGDRAAALALYERAIQSAFRDVADALARRGTIDLQTQAQRDLVESLRKTLELSQARYNGGIDSFLQTLVSQRAYYSAQRALVSTQLQFGTARINVYRALGADPILNTWRDD